MKGGDGLWSDTDDYVTIDDFTKVVVILRLMVSIPMYVTQTNLMLT